MPRFVILKHEMPVDAARSDHWDLLLENGTILEAWALHREPALGQVIAAERLPDHRLLYLDYEGPVSGNRGSVTRWDGGAYRTAERRQGEWIVDLAGQKLPARVVLSAASPHDEKAQRWNVRFSPSDDRPMVSSERPGPA